jgi:putative endonuclease
MTDGRKRLGDAGERYAERQLSEQGWRVRDRKWRCREGELDLVAERGRLLAFVEVKTRRGESHGKAEESVSSSRCDRLLDLAAIYVSEHPDLDDRLWRVDLIAITLDRAGSVVRYTHIEDACLDE